MGLDRADMQIRSGGEAVKTPGVDNPKGEDGVLVVFANQISPQEFDD